MVNWVEVQKQLLRWLAKSSGLRQLAVDVDDSGTVMNFWLPKHKLPQKNKATATGADKADTDKRSKKKKTGSSKGGKPSVVLLHGFAGDGLVNWEFQIGALAKSYDVYVPDLLYFGGSASPSPERTTVFQAACVAEALARLGVERCTVVGFSYGGFVALKMAEARPGLVRSVVVSGAAVDPLTDAMNDALLRRLGATTLAEHLLPESVHGLRSLLAAAVHMKLWLPGFLLRDFLEVMYTNRKERAEMLQSLVIGNEDATVPVLNQRILLLWGENDKHIPIEIARKLEKQLGEKATLQSISDAAHLVHLERPCVYNRCLKKFLADVNAI